MKIWRLILKAPIRVLRIKRKRFSIQFKRQMQQLKVALSQEKKETKEMLIAYKNYTKGNASKEEIKEANEQLVDILKGLGLGVFAVLPFAPITIPLLVKLGKLVGVDILPSAFSSKPKKHKADIIKATKKPEEK